MEVSAQGSWIDPADNRRHKEQLGEVLRKMDEAKELEKSTEAYTCAHCYGQVLVKYEAEHDSWHLRTRTTDYEN